MTLMLMRILKACKPNECILTLTHRELRVVVGSILRDKVGEDCDVRFHELRMNCVFEIVNKIGSHGSTEIIDRCRDKSITRRAAVSRWPFAVLEYETRRGVDDAQQKDIICIDHGRVGRVSMRLPDGSAIKSLE